MIALLTPLLMILGADRLLALRTGFGPADAIVVLGGDGPRRAAQASSLYAAGIAPLVLVSGDGDCRDVRDLLVKAGVPGPSILTECRSRTTWENAERSAPLLAEHGIRSAVLVTSWFHTLRAYGCFRLLAPGIRWTTAPAERDMPLATLVRDFEGLQVLKEYVKVGWYAVRYWPAPFLTEVRS